MRPGRGGVVSPVPEKSGRNALARLQPSTAKGKSGIAIDSDRVLVAVRVRPMLHSGHRQADGAGAEAKEVIKGESSTNCIMVDKEGEQSKFFTYDYVFDRSQEEIYDCIGKTMLREAFAGFNVTLFAYGQTGSGKTYTIQGLPGAGRPLDDPDDPDKEGVVPRLLRDLFDVVQDMLDDDELKLQQIKVTLSFAEVYNEQVRDLLPASKQKGAEPPNLEIHETPSGRIEVRGLSKHTVIGSKKVLELINKGNTNRQVAETKMNECSSRSHSILQLHMEQQYDHTSDRRDCESFINIVDLAGSERQTKTGTQGDQFQESKHINQSLLTLGRALKSFSTGQDGKRHVPLRESKLTRLLSESFGGNSKTWMLATVAPSLYNISESNSTLQYAQAAKSIVNTAKQNRLQRHMELKELQEQKIRLEERLDKAEQENRRLDNQNKRLTDENGRLQAIADPDALARLKKENERLVRENQELIDRNRSLERELGESKEREVKLMDAGTPRTNLGSSRELNPGPSSARGPQGSTHGGLTTPQPGVYIGRAKVSLKNIIEQTSSYLSLPLSNESSVPGANKAILEVNIYPVDAKGSAALPTQRNRADNSNGDEECALLGQRVDFVVHIIRSRNIPKEYCGTVYCKYVYKWAEKDSYKTTDLKDTTDPEFDFKKRFAFSKMNQGLVEYFRSDNVITFEVIGMGTDTHVSNDR